MNNSVTFKGNPLTLKGKNINIGDSAPDFIVLNKDLTPVSLKDLKGKIKIISVTPSLDTPICDAQANFFNKKASELSEDIKIINISVDLPFAISRFCTGAGIDNIMTLSDHKDLSFGTNYGLLINELRLLARAVIIIDKEDIIRYIQLVKEVGEAPDYDEVFEALKKLYWHQGDRF